MHMTAWALLRDHATVGLSCRELTRRDAIATQSLLGLLAEFCCKSEFQTVQNVDLFRTLLVGAVLGLLVTTTAFSRSQFTRRYARQSLIFGSLSFSISLGLVIAALTIGLS